MDLYAEIGKAAEVSIELEGIYKRIVFLPSKVKKHLPVATPATLGPLKIDR